MNESGRLLRASQDPAVTFLALLPLALIHLLFRGEVQAAAFDLVERLLAWVGSPSALALSAALVLFFLWAMGRIRREGLPWRGGMALTFIEGAFWGLLLGPVLSHLTSWLTQSQGGPLALPAAGVRPGAFGFLALSAGAGLYEELVFRAGILAGLAVLLRGTFFALGWKHGAPIFATGLALLASSVLFALAHSWGDPHALDPQVFTFRFLGGVLLGVLFAWRGLAVAAYSHAAYDALTLLG